MGSQQICGMEGKQSGGHTGQDEIIEGNVNGCLPAPVRRGKKTRDPQGGATLQLMHGKDTSVILINIDFFQIKTNN